MSERAGHTMDAPERQLRERPGARSAVGPPAVEPRIPDVAQRLSGGDAQLIGQRYRLATPIGQGAMGTVWRGWDEVLRRPAAIKEVRFPPGVSRAERDSLYWRTLREARAAAQLSHPAVTTVHDVVVTCSRIQASISGRAPHSSTLG
jgi:eukaryotic-like serine/threonine-protein kinase